MVAPSCQASLLLLLATLFLRESDAEMLFVSLPTFSGVLHAIRLDGTFLVALLPRVALLRHALLGLDELVHLGGGGIESLMFLPQLLIAHCERIKLLKLTFRGDLRLFLFLELRLPLSLLGPRLEEVDGASMFDCQKF